MLVSFANDCADRRAGYARRQHLQIPQSANFRRQRAQLIIRNDKHAQFFEFPDLGWQALSSHCGNKLRILQRSLSPKLRGKLISGHAR